ncbi:uncharacterized protein [Antedon mediterranea]|uniref:uncharacterized protein n=1 Tax=Antedon mediterranea TaxID=105859 RepID=UPI003AF63A3A
MGDRLCGSSTNYDSHHTPVSQEEASSTSKGEFAYNSLVSRSTSSLSSLSESEQKAEFHDIVLICSERAKKERDLFLTFCRKQQWKVYLPSMEKLLGERRSATFKRGFDHSTYIVVLITSCFQEDVWAVERLQIALIKSIEERYQNVIPVLFGGLLPFEMSAIANVKYDDEFFEHVMKKSIKTDTRIFKQNQEDCRFQSAQGTMATPPPAYEIESMDSGEGCSISSSYSEEFNNMLTEALPSEISQQYLTTKQFQGLCISLDVTDPGLNDWRGLANSLDLTSSQIKFLEDKQARTSEYSPTKLILDVYFEHNKTVDKSSILKNLNELFTEMNFGRGIQITQEAIETFIG